MSICEFLRSNNFYLILGLLIGFFFGYLIERLKDRRRRNGISSLLKNEITNCGEDAAADLKMISESTDLKAESNVILRQKLSLGGFLISRAMYATTVFESNLSFLWLFKAETQQALINFYNIVFKLKNDFATLRELLKPIEWPPDAIKDTYSRQIKYRDELITKARECIRIL